jgi:hypothetical protein
LTQDVSVALAAAIHRLPLSDTADPEEKCGEATTGEASAFSWPLAF